jgi:hypothetical protein
MKTGLNDLIDAAFIFPQLGDEVRDNFVMSVLISPMAKQETPLSIKIL